MKKCTIVVTMLIAFSGPALAQSNGLGDTHLQALDSDGNASISKKEFDNFASFAFEQMDVDKNGVLGANEVAAHADAEAFSRADADGNGSVSLAEFKARMDANFKAADKDGDGQLN